MNRYEGRGDQFAFTPEAFYDPVERHGDGERIRLEPSVLVAQLSGEPKEALDALRTSGVASDALAGLAVSDVVRYTDVSSKDGRVTAQGERQTPLTVRFSPTDQLPAHAVIESTPEWQAKNYPKKLKKRLAELATAWFHQNGGWVLPPPEW